MSSEDKNDGTGEFELIRAIYDFEATFAKTISFSEGETFLLHGEHTRKRNWWQVVSKTGEIGYIPSNYVKVEKCSGKRYLEFLTTCINTIKNEIKESTKPSILLEKEELLKKLVEKKEALMNFNKTFHNNLLTSSPESPDRQPAPLPPRRSYCSGDGSVLTKQSAPLPKLHDDCNPDSRSKAVIINSKMDTPRKSLTNGNDNATDITPQMMYQLVQLVRRHTELSHELSRVAVNVVVGNLVDLLPQDCAPMLELMLEILQGPLYAHDSTINDTFDAKRLQTVLDELINCKEDSQQRSWELYEDESIIIEYINELLSILNNADGNISRHVLSKDQFRGVCALLEYYQMEARWSIRQPLLQTFGVMCGLHQSIIMVLLNSVLPMELARDMVSNSRNVPRLLNSALLLSMIFCMGEPMPITHLEYLGKDFVSFLLNLIESPPDTDVDEQIPDVFLSLILAYNLQFSTEGVKNVVIDAVASRDVAKIFTEKLLLLLNREEDPVRIFDHSPAPPDSVLKLFNDLFSNERAANLFYTNDIKVLIDVIVRQLADLSPGDARRTQFLELCRLVLKSTNYDEHQHRRSDLHKCFTRIFCEEFPESQMDIALVRDISNEFSQYFK